MFDLLVIFGSGDFVLIFVRILNGSTWYRVFRTAHRRREDTTDQQTMPKLFLTRNNNDYRKIIVLNEVLFDH